MEIHDELMTPGCPQCAIKHLCAALSYAADHNGGDERLERELAARALINLAEAEIGYSSHMDFAIGLLERAERIALLASGGLDFARKARRLRVAIIVKDPREVVWSSLDLHASLYPLSYLRAHLVEAARELPAMHLPTNDTSVETIQALLKTVREEYFDLPEATVAEGEQTPKEEPDMATAKKKAVPAKGAKCAAKGGKTATCAKAACKGGKGKK